MPKVIIAINGNGEGEIINKPDNVEVEIRNYDIPDDFDLDNITCEFDDSGDRYQPIIFPQKKILTFDDDDISIRSYYNHCGEEWESDWDSACDDECPVCGKAISPYKYEDIKEEIGYRPHKDEFPIAGLTLSEVYEDLSMGQDCHPQVKNWEIIYEGDIENPFTIPCNR